VATESGVVTVWPLVGRDQELRQVAAARADVGCSACVIHAPAGVGKSRLAREAQAAADADGVLTLWAQASASSSTIPLGALAGVIPDEVRSDDPFELVRRSAAALRASADGQPVMLVVDDAQLLDPVSATLVSQLVAGRDVFVLATVRAGEPAPDAVDALWRDDAARQVELGPMSDDVIVEMVAGALGGPVEQATVRQIVDVCAGNPLYVRELVSGALEDGRLRRTRGLWRLEGRPTVTPTLAALVTRRIGSLGPDVRRLLELLALGEPLRLQEATAMTSYAALEVAEERGVIVISGPSDDADVRVGHPLYGEVIRGELPVVRGRVLRSELAEVVQRRRPLSADDALRVVRWLVSAGAEVPGELLTDAAEAANLAGDPGLGADLARRAIDAGAGLRAVLILSRAYVVRNRFEDSAEVLAAAEEKVAGDPDAHLYLEYRVHVLQWALRREQEAVALVHRARSWSEDPAWAAQIEPMLVAMAAVTGEPEERLDALRELSEDPRRDPEVRAGLGTSLGVALLAAGRVREADEHARVIRPRPPLRRPTDAYALGIASLTGEDAGEDWQDLDAYMQQTLREAVAVDDHQAAGFAAFTLGALGLRRGHYADSERWLAEAEVELEQHDSFDLLSNVAALRAGVACFTRDPAAAQTAVATMRRRMDGRTPHLGQVVYVACGEGWAARARGDRAGVDVFLAQADATEDRCARSRLLHEALRAGARPDPIAAALTALAAEGDSEGFEARAAHATALARRDAPALLAASEQLDRIGCTAAAVDAVVAAARMFVEQGRSDSARRAALRAGDLYPSGQGWELPSIEGLDGISAGLTKREAQIAGLAAQGLSSPEIADQLVLSVRTVETYIYRAMQKRGVTTRAEL
jgi:DNA-binding NarL/FixJ family response regulator